MKVNTDTQRINQVVSRGVENIYPSREALSAALASGKRLRLYNGIDPTGPSLHLGHAVVLRKLRQFQDLGHEVILLIGDFTGMIGDPTDKSATRKQLTRAEVLKNAKQYKKQASAILRFSGPNPAKLLFNSKWLGKLKFADVLELTSNFTVNHLLERDMFERRLNDGKEVYLHEFLYPVMQGYDSVVMNVDLEVGGNDQTFNMLAGRTLMKKLKNKEKFVLTMKLLTDSSGKKMGKTEGNMVTLADSPAEIYGKVMSWADGLIAPGFEILTSLPLTDIATIAQDVASGVNPKEHKMHLARTVVAELCGASQAAAAEERFVRVFQDRETPADMPTVTLRAAEITLPLVDLFLRAGLVSSKSEARRLAAEGALVVNDAVVRDPAAMVTVTDGSVLRRGKRQFAKVQVTKK